CLLHFSVPYTFISEIYTLSLHDALPIYNLTIAQIGLLQYHYSPFLLINSQYYLKLQLKPPWSPVLLKELDKYFYFLSHLYEHFCLKIWHHQSHLISHHKFEMLSQNSHHIFLVTLIDYQKHHSKSLRQHEHILTMHLSYLHEDVSILPNYIFYFPLKYHQFDHLPSPVVQQPKLIVRLILFFYRYQYQ